MDNIFNKWRCELKVKLCLVLVLLVVTLTACSTEQSPSLTGHQTIVPSTNSKEVVIHYVYPEVPEEWLEQLPRERNSIAFYKASSERWSIVFTAEVYHESVTLFTVKPSFQETKEGCRVYGHPLRIACDESASFEKEITITMEMVYCAYWKDGLLCDYEGLQVLIEDDEITFSAEDSFTAEYRQIVEEILDFKGGADLPLELAPNHSYVIAVEK